MVESAINRHRSRNSSRLNCNFPMYWFVLFHGARTAINVLLAATSFEFPASHCRDCISISFSGVISVANYLLARTKSFDRRSFVSLYCISFARSDIAFLSNIRYPTCIGHRPPWA
jgi:hypothetical protein